MFRGAALHGHARSGLVPHLDCSGLGGVAMEEAHLLQGGKVVVHRGRRAQAYGLTDFAHRRGVAPLAHVGLDEIEDAALAVGELGGGLGGCHGTSVRLFAPKVKHMFARSANSEHLFARVVSNQFKTP